MSEQEIKPCPGCGSVELKYVHGNVRCQAVNPNGFLICIIEADLATWNALPRRAEFQAELMALVKKQFVCIDGIIKNRGIDVKSGEDAIRQLRTVAMDIRSVATKYAPAEPEKGER